MTDVLAWAIAVVVICIAFMLIFRRNIGGLIDRNKSLKLPGGIHAESAETEQQRLPAPQVPDKALASEKLGGTIRDQLLDPIESYARTAIAESVPDPRFHLDWALRLYAMASVARDNEYCYRLIFGSQIRALKSGVQSGGYISEEKQRGYYAEANVAYSDAYQSFPFEEWRGFFTAQKLATLELNGALKLTPKAYAFLSWLATSGAGEDKIF